MLEDFRLRVFMAVEQTGSFTKAAHTLGISQPAVSHNISALEKETGAQLFLRTKGEVSLTSEGNVFKNYAEKILYWYSATSAMFGESGKMSAEKPVRLSADPVIAAYLLPDAISALSGSNSSLSFILTHKEEDESSDSAASDVPGSHFGTPDNADVEISASPSPDTMDFEGEGKLVGVMDAIVVASPGNRSVCKAAVAEGDDEFTAKPFSTIAGIPISNRFAVWSGYRKFFTPDLEARTALTSDSIEAIKETVSRSMSIIGIIPAIAARRELAAGTLLQMPVQLPGFAFDIHFNPLPEFAGKSTCILLRKTLSENLKTI